MSSRFNNFGFKLVLSIYCIFLNSYSVNAENVTVKSVEGINFSMSSAQSGMLLDRNHLTFLQPPIPNTSAVFLKLKLLKAYDLSSFSLDSRYVTSYPFKDYYITFQPTVISVLPFKNGVQSGSAVNSALPVTGNAIQVLNFKTSVRADELVIILYPSINTYREMYLKGPVSKDEYYPYLSDISLTGNPVECEPWVNSKNIYDVNGDNSVAVLDALNIINYLKIVGNGRKLPTCNDHPLKFKVDINGDKIVSTVDALIIINSLGS